MKKKNFIIALVLSALFIPKIMNAQTDVTETYLTNADFNTRPYCYTKAGGTTLTEGVERLIVTTDPARSGWIFAIPGWLNASIIKNNATQVATGEHGLTATPPGFNGIAPPPVNKAGDSIGAVMSMSAGWGDRAVYYQEVSLPSGRYVMKYDAYNGHTATQAVANYFGLIPDTGTPYYGTLINYPQNTWITDSISFFLTEQTTPGRIALGITTASASSNNGPKLFLDNVKLYYYGIDKAGLKQLIDSAKFHINNPEDVGASTVYAELQDIINLAELIFNDTNATAAQVVHMEQSVKEVIDNVFGAITLQKRVISWTNLPYNATEVIVNPSFEQVLDASWSMTGSFTRQSNASFDPFKNGTFYLQRFVTSGQIITDSRLSQLIKNIPNGIYSLTLSAHAIQQADGSYPGGAYLVANDNFVEIFERKDYNITVEVVDNTMEFALEISETGNWVALDNFRLTYLSEGVSPYVTIVPDMLTFTPSNAVASFNLSGGNLTENVTISTGTDFTLSKATFTAAEIMEIGGVELTVNYTGNKAVENDTLTITHGNLTQKIVLKVKETLKVSHGAFLFDQSMVPITNFTVTGDVFNPVTFTLPNGITVAESSIPAANALGGTEVILMWDHTTSIEDKFMYIASGSVKDSILLFATANNLISQWDGDDAEGEGSRLTDFGWSLTQADGETPVNGAFNEYNSPSFGIRYVPYTNQNYNYYGKAFKGHRAAYLRTWGTAPSTNVYNLPVLLTEGKAYKFRTIASWHDNGTTPTFSFAINSKKSNTGDTLGIASVRYTATRRVNDFNFIVRPAVTDTFYVTASSNVGGDALLSLLYMSLYETDPSTSLETETENKLTVYPTIARGFVNIDTAGETGMLQIFDLTGKQTTSKVLNGNPETVVLPSEGVYILRINAGDKVKTVKIINLK